MVFARQTTNKHRLFEFYRDLMIFFLSGSAASQVRQIKLFCLPFVFFFLANDKAEAMTLIQASASTAKNPEAVCHFADTFKLG